jgi:hypothetical protein
MRKVASAMQRACWAVGPVAVGDGERMVDEGAGSADPPHADAATDIAAIDAMHTRTDPAVRRRIPL